VEIDVDVRLIAATHRDLGVQVAEGRFRGDLLYRLNVFSIPLPPLRERRDDILPLARRFLAEHPGPSKITPEAERLLVAYDWPGNVRELRNVMERAAILCPAQEAIAPEHLPPLTPRMVPRTDDNDPGGTTIEDAERRSIVKALQASGGRIRAAAQALGISRGTLYRKIEKYGLDGDD
jgi:DNA-binding NtrC family response regulator